MIGHFHAKAITAMTGGTLHSVFDLRQEAADKLAGEYGATAYSDIAPIGRGRDGLGGAVLCLVPWAVAL